MYNVPADIFSLLFIFSFYIFALTFWTFLAIISVQSLNQAIERQYAIPACSQVLLVSGGEQLEINNRVCSYAAGTDTNPIFMFSNSLEPRNPPQPWPSIAENGEPFPLLLDDSFFKLPLILQKMKLNH